MDAETEHQKSRCARFFERAMTALKLGPRGEKNHQQITHLKTMLMAHHRRCSQRQKPTAAMTAIRFQMFPAMMTRKRKSVHCAHPLSTSIHWMQFVALKMTTM